MTKEEQTALRPRVWIGVIEQGRSNPRERIGGLEKAEAPYRCRVRPRRGRSVGEMDHGDPRDVEALPARLRGATGAVGAIEGWPAMGSSRTTVTPDRARGRIRSRGTSRSHEGCGGDHALPIMRDPVRPATSTIVLAPRLCGSFNRRAQATPSSPIPRCARWPHPRPPCNMPSITTVEPEGARRPLGSRSGRLTCATVRRRDDSSSSPGGEGAAQTAGPWHRPVFHVERPSVRGHHRSAST
jgi:hypothetical protein